MSVGPLLLAWKKNPVFRFFSSVKLAVVLLFILILGAAVGTICESRFNTQVARAYIYEAPWFNVWLLLLAVNVAAAALSRYPWQKRHTGFLITHAGIITLLAGSMIGRIWGLEGTMTLFQGDQPTNRLVINQKVVRIKTDHEVETFPVELKHLRPAPSKATWLGKTSEDWKLEVTDYSEQLQAMSDLQRVTQDGSPAIQIHLWNPKMGMQEFKQWLWPDDAENAAWNVGLMAVECRRVTGASAAVPVSSDSFQSVQDRMTIFYGEDGHLTFQAHTKKGEEFHGPLPVGQPMATHWGDWQIKIEEVVPQAFLSTKFVPVSSKVKLTKAEKMNCTEGVKVRFSRGDQQVEEWLAAGWQVGLPMKDAALQASFGLQIYPLPFNIELKNFQVERNEGNDSPASFKSSLSLKDAEGNASLGSCSMNEPMNYPDTFWRVWTGFTYKVSQASWNPENLKQSSIQILFDPGWSLKWIGSLMICLGIFTMFYLRPNQPGPKKLPS